MKEFFSGIPVVKYEGKSSANPMSFRFYNPDELIQGKPMREHLRFALSYWHTMCGDGTDRFGRGTYVKNFGAVDPMDIYRNKAYAAFELMDKLSVDFFCFHDRDIAPEGDTLKETNARLDEIADLLERLMKEHGKKLRMIPVEADTLSVDTLKDLDYVRHVGAEKIKKGELTL